MADFWGGWVLGNQVMANGKIVQDGSYASLASGPGAFRELLEISTETTAAPAGGAGKE